MIGYARPSREKGKFVDVFNKIDSATRTPKILGSMVLHLAYVASGSLDAAILISPRPWDMAAGSLLVQEAGGRVTDFEGRPWSLNSENILATNGKIHEELLKVLNS
jgi:myo-inositol-1(or 4)-monophosphatase